MKKLILLILLFSILLAGCGAEADPNCGVYNCEQLIFDGKKLAPDSLFDSAPVLELSGKGKALLTLNNEVYEGQWSCEGEDFRLTTGDAVSEGTLSGGICRLDLMGTGLTYCFYSRNSPLPQWGDENAGDPQPMNNSWSGDWYGYWSISDASGDWAPLDGKSFDCFAHIDMPLNGLGSIRLWDESTSLDRSIADVRLSLSGAGENEFGHARSVSGTFFDQELPEGRWNISPGRQRAASLIRISSRYYSEKGSFKYEIILRPWAYIWDDVIQSGEYRLPFYYESWYLPTLAKNLPMPDWVDFSAISVLPFPKSDGGELSDG